jgi:hypothetical protein
MDLIIVFFGLLVVVALRVFSATRAGWRLMATTGVLLALTVYSWAAMLFNADQSATHLPPVSRRFGNVAMGFAVACIAFLLLTVGCLVYAWRRRPAATSTAR